MNKASNRARSLARALTTLEPRDLARIAGGNQVGSTSTSGTPEAGDDTVGDDLVSPRPPGGFINNHNLTRVKGHRR